MKHNIFVIFIVMLAALVLYVAPALAAGPYKCSPNYDASPVIYDNGGFLNSAAICEAAYIYRYKSKTLYVIYNNGDYPTEAEWNAYLNSIEPKETFSAKLSGSGIVLAATTDGKYVTVKVGDPNLLPPDTLEKMRSTLRDGIKDKNPTRGFVDAIWVGAVRAFNAGPTPTPKPTPDPSITPVPFETAVVETVWDFLWCIYLLIAGVVIYLLWHFRYDMKNAIWELQNNLRKQGVIKKQYDGLMTKIAACLRHMNGYFQMVQDENNQILPSALVPAQQEAEAAWRLFQELKTSDEPLEEKLGIAKKTLLSILGYEHRAITSEEFRKLLTVDDAAADTDEVLRSLRESMVELTEDNLPSIADRNQANFHGILDRILMYKSRKR